MQVQLTFREVTPSIEIEQLAFQEAHKLDQLFPQQLQWCHVVIDQPHRHHHRGRSYRVRVTLQGELGTFVSDNGPEIGPAVASLATAVSDAFRSARHQIRRHVHRRGRPRGGRASFALRTEEGTPWA